MAYKDLGGPSSAKKPKSSKKLKKESVVVTTGLSFPERRSPYVDHMLSLNSLSSYKTQHLAMAHRRKYNMSGKYDNKGQRVERSPVVPPDGHSWKGSSITGAEILMANIQTDKSNVSRVFTIEPEKTHQRMMSILESLRKLQKQPKENTVLGSLVVKGNSPRGHRNPVTAWAPKTQPNPPLRVPSPKGIQPESTPAASDAQSTTSDLDYNEIDVRVEQKVHNDKVEDYEDVDEDCLCPDGDYRKATGEMLQYYLNEENRQYDECEVALERIPPMPRSAPLRHTMTIRGSKVDPRTALRSIRRITVDDLMMSDVKPTTGKQRAMSMNQRSRSGRLFMGRRVTASALKEQGNAAPNASNHFLNINAPMKFSQRTSDYEKAPKPPTYTAPPEIAQKRGRFPIKSLFQQQRVGSQKITIPGLSGHNVDFHQRNCKSSMLVKPV